MTQVRLRYLFVGCLLFCISTHNLQAQSSAGTMPTDTLFVCNPTGELFIQNNGDEEIQIGHALNYIIINVGLSGEILATSTDGRFLWEELFQRLDFSDSNCDNFFVRAIAGPASNDGLVDLSDPSLISTSNASRLVIFGVGVPIEDESMIGTTLESLEGEENFMLIDAPCWDTQPSDMREKSTACDYPCSCVDTLYVTSIDTTWYIANTDTTRLQTSGDTIFRTLLIAPDYNLASEHVDTIIFDDIHAAAAGFRIQNGRNILALASFELYFDIVYGFDLNLAVLDTILEERCEAELPCPSILVNIGYDGTCPNAETPILYEEVSVCSADSVRSDTLFLQSVVTTDFVAWLRKKSEFVSL